MHYSPDLNMGNPVLQTWQLSPSMSIPHETPPSNLEMNQASIGYSNNLEDNAWGGFVILGGSASFESMMEAPDEGPLPSSVSPPISASPQISSSSPASGIYPRTWSFSSNQTGSTPPHGCVQSAQSSPGTHNSLAPPSQSSSPPGKPFDDSFVAWDPANPRKTDPREKIPRTKAELKQQREDAAALKMVGGTCLCCYRAKKKCSVTSPCVPCASKRKGQRICYRHWEDLCLIGLPVRNSVAIVSFPTQEAKDTLQTLCDNAFGWIEEFNAVVNIRKTYGGEYSTWHWAVMKSNITLDRTDCPIDAFLAGVTNALPEMNLVKFEDLDGTDPLISSTLKIANTFRAAEALAQGKIRTAWSDINPGRLIFFYLLVLSLRNLVNMSEDLCPSLYEAMCGKDKHNSDKKSDSPPRDGNKIDSGWVAAALYYRVLCGLKDLQDNLIVARIFGSSSGHLSAVCDKLEDFLRNVSPKHGASRKSPNLAILEDKIPPFPSSPGVDMAFWLAQDGPEMTAALSQRDSPFSSPSDEMRVFLADDFPIPQTHNFDAHNGQSSSSQGAVATQGDANNAETMNQSGSSGSTDTMNTLTNNIGNGYDPMITDFSNGDLFRPVFLGSLYNC